MAGAACFTPSRGARAGEVGSRCCFVHLVFNVFFVVFCTFGWFLDWFLDGCLLVFNGLDIGSSCFLHGFDDLVKGK